MPKVGKRISQLRKLNKLTQKEFANRTQIAYRHYQDIEADKANIRLSTAKDIAAGLSIPLSSLFDHNHNFELFGIGLKDSWQILEHLPIGICVSNLEGRLVYLNSFFKSNLMGQFQEKNLKNLFVWDLLPSESKDQGRLEYLRMILEKSSPKPAQRTYLSPEKKEFKFLICWNSIRDELKNCKGFVIAALPLPKSS